MAWRTRTHHLVAQQGGSTMTLNRAIRVLLVAGLLLPAGASMADVGSAFKCHRRAHHAQQINRGGEDKGDKDDGKGDRKSIPEFDPAAAGSIAALLMGGGLLLVRRRRAP
jgi:hypothetical protein